jgi:hypothetical protein
LNKNKKNEKVESQEVKIVLEIDNDKKLPQYCNQIQIRFTPFEYIFDFVYVDASRPYKNEKDTIIGSVVSRVCMTHKTAEDFLNAFNSNLKRFKKINQNKDKK